MRKLLLLALLLAAPAFAQTWTHVTAPTMASDGGPAGNGYLWINYDPVSQQTIFYSACGGSTSIYSGCLYAYNSSTHTFTYILGTNTQNNTQSNATTDTPTLPRDRHPTCQAIDTKRNVLWLFSGVNGGSFGGHYVYHLSLNADPTADTWTRTGPPTHLPPEANNQSCVYDATNDVLQWHGYDGGSGGHDNWMYCPSLGNPGGTLTATQTAAGCSAVDDWQEICPSSALTCTQSTSAQPGGVYGGVSPGLYYDAPTGKIIFAGGLGHPTTNQIWSYSLTPAPGGTWTQKCSGCTLAPNSLAQPDFPAAAYNTTTHKLYYHQVDNTGAPNDYVYDPSADTLTNLGTNDGPTAAGTASYAATYDAAQNKIIAWAQNSTINLWEAQLSGTSTVTGQFRILGSWPSGNAKWIKVCGVVPALSAGGTATVTLTGPGGLTVPLTVQEALYAGGSTGIARTDEPFCQGVPIADSAGITSTTGLALAGATGVVDTDLATDGTTIAVDTGAADFGVRKANFNVIDTAVVGATTLLATSSSSTRGLVMKGPSTTGTFPDNVTCGTGSGKSACTTVYSSANDPNSTCSIEENGPVLAVVKCTGTHFDSASHPYMQYTAREYFYVNSSNVKVDVILRNANYDTSSTPSSDAGGNTFNTAYKGFASYELRLAPAITGTLTYRFTTDGGNFTGTLNQSGGTDFAYIYSGQSNYLYGYGVSNADCAKGTACAALYTTDNGYVAYKNATALSASSADAASAAGWLDCTNSSGVGLQIGIYQMSAYFPKSLECVSGGADMRIGLYPSENGAPTAGPGNGTFYQYQAWPAWSITTTFLNFHAAAPSSLANDFLKQQHYLVSRPSSLSYINAVNVFPYPIVDPTVESDYYLAIAQAANPAINVNTMCYGWTGSGTCVPTPDRGYGISTLNNNNLNLGVFRKWDYSAGGQQNQQDWRWNDLMKFYQRGMTGRLLNSSHFYRMQAEKFVVHADGISNTSSALNGFAWRDRQATTEINAITKYPAMACGGDTCALLNNSASSFVTWEPGHLHFHWHGMIDYYYMSGDETVRDAILPMVDQYWATDAGTYGPSIARGIGIDLSASAHLADFLGETGDSTNQTTVLAHALNLFDVGVKPDACLNGYPAGCTAPPLGAAGGAYEVNGVSKVRGQPAGSRGQFCPSSTSTEYYRIDQPFETDILIEGVLHFARAKGSSWNEYNTAMDIAYGMGQAQTTEGYAWDGTAHWRSTTYDPYYGSGFRYELPLDIATNCTNAVPGGTVTTSGTTVTRVSGSAFDSTFAGRRFYINGNFTTVASVNVGAQTLALTATLGTYATAVPYQTAPTGYATSSGTTLIWSSGPQFDNSWVGSYISFNNGGVIHVDSVQDPTHLTLHSSVGTVGTPTAYLINSDQNGVQYSNLYVVKLIDGTHRDAQNFALTGSGTLWNNLWSLYKTNNTFSDWKTKFDIALVRAGYAVSLWIPDYGSIKVGALIDAIHAASTYALQDVAFSVIDNGSGNYHLNFILPSGATYARVKWSALAIAPSNGMLGFDPTAQTFAINPNANMTWFGANTTNDVTICASGCPTGAQSFAIATGGVTGLTSTHFSVKAMYATGEVSPIPPTITSNSILTGGTVGEAYSQQLAATGAATITWEITDRTAPDHVTLSSSGLLSGTPDTAGIYTFTVTATNDTGNDAVEFSLTIGGGPAGPTNIIRGRVTMKGRIIL